MTAPSSGAGVGSSELELRPFARALSESLRSIALVAVIAAVIGFVVTSFLDDVYRARASLLILAVRSQASLATELTTVVSASTESGARQHAFVTVAKDDAVAVAVYERLRGTIESSIATPIALKGMVEVTAAGELLLVDVRGKQPQLIADIATTWADEAMRRINSLYGRSVQPMEEIRDQLNKAHGHLQRVQGELEEFLVTTRSFEFAQEIRYLEDLRGAMAKSLGEAELAAFGLALDARREALEERYGERNRVSMALARATELADGLGDGAGSARRWALALELIELHMQRIDGEPAEAPDVAVNLAGEPPSVSSSDVQALLATLSRQRDRIELEIAALQKELLGPETSAEVATVDNPIRQRWRALGAEVASLTAQHEAATHRRQELTAARDIARQTFEVLTRKLAEVDQLQRIPGSEVRLIADASPPRRPIGPRRGLNTVLAGLLGMISFVTAIVIGEARRQMESSNQRSDVADVGSSQGDV